MTTDETIYEFNSPAWKLKKSNDELIAAIKRFCESQEWADESWKNQPHVKALFDLNKKHNN